MPFRSFRNPNTGVLVAWGAVLTNGPGEIAQLEPDGFNLEVGKWRWDGSQWVPYTAPPAPPSPLKLALVSALSNPGLDSILRPVLAALRDREG